MFNHSFFVFLRLMIRKRQEKTYSQQSKDLYDTCHKDETKNQQRFGCWRNAIILCRSKYDSPKFFRILRSWQYVDPLYHIALIQYLWKNKIQALMR